MMLQRANGSAHDSNAHVVQPHSTAATATESPDEHQRFVVPGIQNLGNTCFFNAILQALASVSSFQEYLDEIVRQSKLKGHTHRIPFASALRDCIEELAPTLEHEPRATIVPRRLNAELVTKLTAFRGNKQQDSQELLQFLMNLVTDEQKRCAVRDHGLQDLTSSLEFLTTSISDLRHDELVRNRKCWNPMHGLQVNLLQCTRCRRYRPMRNHRFLDVSLSLSVDPPLHASYRSPQTPQAPASSVPLTACLRKYTEPEAIDGVECSYCSVEQELRVTKTEFDAVKRQLDREKARADDVALEIAQHERSEWIHTLEQALRSSSSDSARDRVVHLEACGPHRVVPRVLQQCHKRMQFSRAPDVFCFHLTRKLYHATTHSARKVETHVSFPFELDMSAFCAYEQAASDDSVLAHGGSTRSTSSRSHYASSNSNGATPTTTSTAFMFAAPLKTTQLHLLYTLQAVILHHGNERSGHFTAFRRIPNGQWFFVSDESVRAATETEVLASCAYMLFYERKHRVGGRDLSGTTSFSTDDDDSLPDVSFE